MAAYKTLVGDFVSCIITSLTCILFTFRMAGSPSSYSTLTSTKAGPPPYFIFHVSKADKTVKFDSKREKFVYVEKKRENLGYFGKNGEILVIFGKIFFFRKRGVSKVQWENFAILFRERVVSKVQVKVSKKIRYNRKNGLYHRTVRPVGCY